MLVHTGWGGELALRQLARTVAAGAVGRGGEAHLDHLLATIRNLEAIEARAIAHHPLCLERPAKTPLPPHVMRDRTERAATIVEERIGRLAQSDGVCGDSVAKALPDEDYAVGVG